mmetsp:Transcript_13451/g.42909  ORF Transcript_13451/g.42909 Transcript_13451/m.42909 type:complete len:258 (+) Transcript_13451:536-1309(+)
MATPRGPLLQAQGPIRSAKQSRPRSVALMASLPVPPSMRLSDSRPRMGPLLFRPLPVAKPTHPTLSKRLSRRRPPLLGKRPMALTARRSRWRLLKLPPPPAPKADLWRPNRKLSKTSQRMARRLRRALLPRKAAQMIADPAKRRPLRLRRRPRPQDPARLAVLSLQPMQARRTWQRQARARRTPRARAQTRTGRPSPRAQRARTGSPKTTTRRSGKHNSRSGPSKRSCARGKKRSPATRMFCITSTKSFRSAPRTTT